MSTETKTDPWIKCTDQLPERGRFVLMFQVNGGDYTRRMVGVWHPSMGHGGDFALIIPDKRGCKLVHHEGVTHWAELPGDVPTT